MLHRFAGFELDDQRYELRGGEAPIELQPKVMEVLLYLLRNAERTLSRDEILDAVWPGVSVGEASLTRCIGQARRALGDSEADARIIQTVRRRGYRIGVAVEHRDPLAAVVPDSEEPALPMRRRFWKPIAAGAAVALVVLAWLARPLADLSPLLPPQIIEEPASRAVAVLPFTEIGLAPDGRRLGESVALDVTDRLSEVTELRVMSPAASFRFGEDGGADRGPAEIAAELGVGSLVLGRLRPVGERLRVEIELVDAETGFRRWSQSYERSPDEILSLQEEVASEVARVLGISVQSGPSFVRKEPDVEATHYVLQGRVGVLSARRDQLLDAVVLYERAIEHDPTLPAAYVALAAAYEHLWNDDDPGVGWLSRAEAVILRALELDPDSSEAWRTYGTVLRARRDWGSAEEALRRAIELGPNATAFRELARIRCMLGRPLEARPFALRALELDPLSVDVQHVAGRVFYYLGEDERAISHLRRAHQLAPRAAYVTATLSSALQANGRTAEASEVFLLALPSWIRAPLRIHWRLAGAENGLRLVLALDAAAAGRPCGRDAYESAVMRARVGDGDGMLACLEEAARHHLFYVRAEPIFDPYREDPTFQRILREAGFGDR